MLNKLLIAGLCLMSTMAYAESISSITAANPINFALDYSKKLSTDYSYDYSVKNKDGSINFYISTKLGQVVPLSSTAGKGDNCILQIKDAVGTSELSLSALPSSSVQLTILPLKEKNGMVETLIDLSSTKSINKENAQAINENCSIANTLLTTTNLRWLGDLSFDKEKTIKLSNGDELYITLSHQDTKK